MKIKIVVIFLATSAIACVAQDQSSSVDQDYRSLKFEVYGFGEYFAGGNTTTFSGGNVSTQFGSGFGGGAGLGINLSDHFNVNTEFGGAGVSVMGAADGVSIVGSASVINWNINLDYNILKGRFTPFVTGGAGVTFLNGDFGMAGSEFSETDLGFNVGVGVRWDFSTHWFLKAAYHANWTSLQSSDNLALFHSVSVAVGFKF